MFRPTLLYLINSNKHEVEIWKKELNKNSLEPSLSNHRKIFSHAIIKEDGSKEYWRDGFQYSLLDEYMIARYSSKFSCIFHKDGIIEYHHFSFPNYLESFEGLPSRVFPNGTKEWHKSGKLHREFDLPAIEYSNGDKEYWMFGHRHRDEGPAIIYGDKKYWYIWGNFMRTNEGFWNKFFELEHYFILIFISFISFFIANKIVSLLLK